MDVSTHDKIGGGPAMHGQLFALFTFVFIKSIVSRNFL
jgi:hypothetical protein